MSLWDNSILRVDMRSAAGISPCGLYRYWLSRVWDESLPLVCFVMLNPSTADALQDDPTIRRCIGFAKAWGCGRLEVRNLFSYRATDPGDMKRALNPTGGDEGDLNLALAGWADRVIVAWGCHGTYLDRDKQAVEMITVERGRRGPIECLGLTKDGHPRHPLYVKGDAKPVPFAPASAAPAAGGGA